MRQNALQQRYNRPLRIGPQSVKPELRDSTLEVFNAAIPTAHNGGRAGKRMTTLEYRTSRARKHLRDNPLWTLKEICKQKAADGAPMSQLLLLAADLECHIRSLYVLEVTPEAIREASLMEAVHDADETTAQLAMHEALHSPDPNVRREGMRDYRLKALRVRSSMDRVIIKVTGALEAK